MWCTSERRFVWHVCLRNPCLLWNLSLHCLPEAWGPWEPQYAPPILHYAACKLCLYHAHPFVAAAEERSVSCREAKGLVTELLWSLCLLQRKLLAFVGWKWGCQRFSWRCLQNVRHCRKEICSTCLFKESIPAKFPVFIFARTFKSWRDQRVGKRGLLSRESQSSSNSRVDVWVLNQW